MNGDTKCNVSNLYETNLLLVHRINDLNSAWRAAKRRIGTGPCAVDGYPRVTPRKGRSYSMSRRINNGDGLCPVTSHIDLRSAWIDCYSCRSCSNYCVNHRVGCSINDIHGGVEMARHIRATRILSHSYALKPFPNGIVAVTVLVFVSMTDTVAKLVT